MLLKEGNFNEEEKKEMINEVEENIRLYIYKWNKTFGWRRLKPLWWNKKINTNKKWTIFTGNKKYWWVINCFWINITREKK